MADDAEVPLGGSPNDLEELVRIVKGQPVAREKLRENIDGFNVDRAIRYGTLLGFIQQNPETGVVSVTDRGTEIFYAGKDSSEQESIYIRAISAYEPYHRISESLLCGRSDLVEVTKSEVGQQIELGLGIERASSTISRGASTYLRTLVAAGVGEYKRGTSTTETRVEIDDSGAIDELLDSISSSPSADGDDTQVKSEEAGTPPSHDGNSASSDRFKNRVMLPISDETSSATLELSVVLELSGDEDPDQLQRLVAAVRSGWRGASSTDSDQTSSDSDTVVEADRESAGTEEEQVDDGEETESDTLLSDF